MATESKQVVYTPVEIDDGEYVDFEQDAKMEEENAEFEKFKSEMHDAQDDAKIMVGKKLTDSRGRPLGKQVFECFECGIDDYTFSQLCTRIREDFGTGLYQILGRDSNGKFKFRKIVGVQAPNTPDNAPVPGTDIGMLIDKFSDAMQRQQMRTEAMFNKLVGPQTGGDAFDQMTKMMGAMGSMMGAMGVNPQAPKSMLDQLTEFKMLQELFTGGNGGGGGGESNLFSLLTETVKSFGPALGMAIAAQKETGAIPMTGPVVAQLAPIEKEEPTLSKELESMRPQINFLIAQAKSGATAQAVADAIIPGIPENALESIEAFLQQENCLDLCAQVNPEVDQWRNWFLQWREIMLKTIGEMFTDEPPLDPGLQDGEIIGGEPLTTEPQQEQTGDAVAGDQQEPSISATASKPDSSNPDDSAAGNGGNAGNA